MRKIKFRGKSYDGSFRYGDLIQRHGQKYIGEECGECRIYPDSIAQLVGYDTDGKEIYEGDCLIAENGIPIYASIGTFARIEPADDVFFSELAKKNNWKLKADD